MTTAVRPLDARDRPRLAAKCRLRADRVRGGQVLLYPEGVLLLSPTAVAVLALCDGRRDVARVADELAHRHGATTGRVLPDVVAFLTRLRERGLVRVADDAGAAQ
jgi:pyrroloquinoline quinone biosynthesis protein D